MKIYDRTKAKIGDRILVRMSDESNYESTTTRYHKAIIKSIWHASPALVGSYLIEFIEDTPKSLGLSQLRYLSHRKGSSMWVDGDKVQIDKQYYRELNLQQLGI